MCAQEKEKIRRETEIQFQRKFAELEQEKMRYDNNSSHLILKIKL